jgi:hypothetical protein
VNFPADRRDPDPYLAVVRILTGSERTRRSERAIRGRSLIFKVALPARR